MWYYFAIFDWFHTIFCWIEKIIIEICEREQSRQDEREREKIKTIRDFCFIKKSHRWFQIFCEVSHYMYYYLLCIYIYFVYVQSFAWFEHATNAWKIQKKCIKSARTHTPTKYFWIRINIIYVFVSGISICEFFISFHN